MVILDAHTPVYDNTTRSFVIQVRYFFKLGICHKGSVKRTQKLLQQDEEIVESLSPHYLSDALEAEVSVEQDKFMSAWRKVLRVHSEEKGWKIDTPAMEPLIKEKVFTIPSPARRANPDLRWALDTVPLVPPLKKPVQSVPSSGEGQA